VAYLGPVRRWDLFRADLQPTVGQELQGEGRPVLVVSNDGFNQYQPFKVVTVVPLTKIAGKQRKAYPFEVFLPKGRAGNPEDSLVQPHQIRTISRLRILQPPLGHLDDPVLQEEIENKILDHLGIEFEDD
jgi:mRNA interferase MazF